MAEWRAMLKGHEQRRRRERYDQAWAVSYALMAAGCKAEDVTPAKLLGEREPVSKERRREIRKGIERMRQRVGPDLELLRLAHQASRGKVGGDLLAFPAPAENRLEGVHATDE